MIPPFTQSSMTSVFVYGEEFKVPKLLVDELARLRALERQIGDEERDRLTRAYEAQHGPLPPPKPSEWVEVDSQAGWPAHLRDDAPYLVCDECGRKTWASDDKAGHECLMPQPNGTACEGRFRSES